MNRFLYSLVLFIGIPFAIFRLLIKDTHNTSWTRKLKKKLGIVCVKEKNGKIGIITDGDLRRHSNNLYKKTILKVTIQNFILLVVLEKLQVLMKLMIIVLY